jgi:enoyl-CoA hydratase/carnithine racemase
LLYEANEGMAMNTLNADVLLHEVDDRGVHFWTLNDPARYNVLSDTMLDQMLAATQAVANDTQARAVVIGAQGRAFCAGHDLKAMANEVDIAGHQALFAKCSRMMLGLMKLPVPVIAKVQAIATAAGCQLVAQADLAVAAESAQFGVNGIDIGLFCATPSVALTRNVGIKAAMEMLMTGDFLSADQAKVRGLVNRVCSASELDNEVEQLLQRLLSKPKEAIAMGKALVYQQREAPIGAAYQMAAHTMAVNMMHPVAQEGAQAFVNKRKPNWN